MTAFDIRSKRLAAARQKLVVADLQRQVDALTLRAPVTGQVGQLAVPDRTKVAKDAANLDTAMARGVMELIEQIHQEGATVRELRCGTARAMVPPVWPAGA